MDSTIENDAVRYIEDLVKTAALISVDNHEPVYQICFPPWFDETKFKRGQRFFRDNYVAIGTASLCGLMTVLTIPSILKVLMFTERSSTPEMAYGRYVRTVMYVMNWYFYELKPKSTTDKEVHYIEALVNDGAKIPIDSDVGSYEISLPPWYDEEKFKRGQQFFRENLSAVVAAGFCGLISVLTIPSILEVLIFTRQSSTSTTAYKRYVLTVLHTLNWYIEELRPGSNSWKSMEYVRRIHAVSGQRANAKDSRMLVSQKDVAITQFGFVGYVVLSYRKLGVQYSREGMEGFVHLWRTIGFMLGLEDRFNLCTGELNASYQRMMLVNDHFMRPGLQNSSAEFTHMSRAMIDGMWCYSTLLEYDAFMFLTRRLSSVPGHYYWTGEPRDGTRPVYKELGWFSRVMLFVLMTIHEVLLNITVLRLYFNWMFRFNTTVVNKYFPVLAMIKHGFRKAYVKIVY